jgi:hypothetical protein
LVNDNGSLITGQFAGAAPGSQITIGDWFAAISYTGNFNTGQISGGVTVHAPCGSSDGF